MRTRIASALAVLAVAGGLVVGAVAAGPGPSTAGRIMSVIAPPPPVR